MAFIELEIEIEMNSTSERKYLIIGIVILVSIIFVLRLFYLQIYDDSFKLSANNNVLRPSIQYPARGLIYDRKGKLLVFNEAVYDLMLTPKQLKKIDTAEFCKLIGISKEDFILKVTKARQYSLYKASLFEKQLSSQTYAALQEKLYSFPGFFVEERTVRKYPDKIASHVLGYIGEVDTTITRKNAYYKKGDYIGISGIERSYENVLRGKRGIKLLMVDVHNRIKGSFQDGKHDTLAVSGENLISSIDRDLQLLGEALMKNKIGSLVAIEPSTGEILAMVSNPSYDPNLLVGRVRSQNYRKLLFDPIKPLFNRALMAQYPPGSTFKLIMALIGQQEKMVFPESRYPCYKGYPPGGGKPACHQHPSPLNLQESIQHSCNSYYSYVFRNVIDNPKYKNTETSFEAWKKNIASFGVGVKLPVDLPNVLKGSVPSVNYYNKYFGKGHWKSSTIISLGIGQGELGMNPLQMANVAAIIANRGYYYTPHIVKAIGDRKLTLPEYTKKQYTSVAASYFNVVVEGMAAVVEAGTAAGSKIENIQICGKTGTAQNPHGKDHSLFMCFAPKDNPKIAMAVVVENSGFGSTWAAPIASLMIEKYLTDSVKRKEMETRILEGNLIPSKADSLKYRKK